MQERKGSEGKGGGTELHRDLREQGCSRDVRWLLGVPPARLSWSRSPKVAPAWAQWGLCTDGGVPGGVLQRGRLTAGGVGDGGGGRRGW